MTKKKKKGRKKRLQDTQNTFGLISDWMQTDTTTPKYPCEIEMLSFKM